MADEVRFCEQCGVELVDRPSYRKDGRIHSWRVPERFCSKACTSIFNCGIARTKSQENAKGHIDKHGYRILARSKKFGYGQPEHRKVMETVIGRKLEKHETVHHKNGIRKDNRPGNLELWSSRHGRGQRVTDVEHSFGITEGLI